jgi:hypothetical protein
VLELLDTEADVHGAARSDSAACYRLPRQMGIFGPAAPARLPDRLRAVSNSVSGWQPSSRTCGTSGAA